MLINPEFEANDPVVSIITPSFNRADIIEETAKSIFRQTYPNWEWVIVDDGSTDNSWEVIQQFSLQDKRVKVFQRNREPKGACTCRNIAVEKSSGDYVLFLDSDDLLASHCLEQRVRAAQQNPSCDFIIFPMLLFKERPDDLKLLWNIDKDEDDLIRILKGEPICQGTGTLWKKASFQQIGMWRVDLKLWQDIELHIRAMLWPLKVGKRMDLAPDTFLRLSDNSLSRTGYHSLPKLKSRIGVMRYAVETIETRGLLEKYRDGLRHMAVDVIVSAIHSGYFSEVKSILQFYKSHSLFTDTEVRHFRSYGGVCKYKLHHIAPVKSYFYKKVREVIAESASTIGTIRWDNPVVL